MAATLPQNLRDIWADMYALHANFDGMGNSVEDWTAFWKTSASIIGKHNENKLCTELVLAIGNYLEHERKQMTKEKAECRADREPEGKGTGDRSSSDTQSGSRRSRCVSESLRKRARLGVLRMPQGRRCNQPGHGALRRRLSGRYPEIERGIWRRHRYRPDANHKRSRPRGGEAGEAEGRAEEGSGGRCGSFDRENDSFPEDFCKAILDRNEAHEALMILEERRLTKHA